jgi:hypothetical protein
MHGWRKSSICLFPGHQCHVDSDLFSPFIRVWLCLWHWHSVTHAGDQRGYRRVARTKMSGVKHRRHSRMSYTINSEGIASGSFKDENAANSVTSRSINIHVISQLPDKQASTIDDDSMNQEAIVTAARGQLCRSMNSQ